MELRNRYDNLDHLTNIHLMTTTTNRTNRDNINTTNTIRHPSQPKPFTNNINPNQDLQSRSRPQRATRNRDNHNTNHDELARHSRVTYDNSTMSIDDSQEEEDSLSEALLAITTAEEYAAKITKLQQACLRPLKEDLADWLNKVMKTSVITTDNFMQKLDNGVFICRLAKIISLWCLEQPRVLNQALKGHNKSIVSVQNILSQHSYTQAINSKSIKSHKQLLPNQKLNTPRNYPKKQNENLKPRLFSSSLNIFSQSTKTNPINGDINDFTDDQRNDNGIISSISPKRQIYTTANLMKSSRISSRSTNCLASSPLMSSPSTMFLNNLVQMDQTKIWDNAKSRTFYARDNVSNFIRWSKAFGVNQSVLFESDDLVQHANPRQVVLCLLDVARIAHVKHGFSEAPGLVKFEQEINRELANEMVSSPSKNITGKFFNFDGENGNNNSASSENKPLMVLRPVGSRMTDATDELIFRYCKHKEEEKAARDKAAELKSNTNIILNMNGAKSDNDIDDESNFCKDDLGRAGSPDRPLLDTNSSLGIKQDTLSDTENFLFRDSTSVSDRTSESIDKQIHDEEENGQEDKQSELGKNNPSSTSSNGSRCYEKVDSLDSGQGRTESASTSHSQSLISSTSKKQSSSIPTLIKRSSSSMSLTSNPETSMSTSELSTSHSSLLSVQDGLDQKRHNTSDLDGKVMRIAKSYYGEGAKKGITRLSEGKYRIADRIVFVRLLKGSRVMVRIGGGWDTLENFLYRHKSDPSQVIDVDNLLPLNTKMPYDKTPQSTPGSVKSSKLPYYRRLVLSRRPRSSLEASSVKR